MTQVANAHSAATVPPAGRRVKVNSEFTRVRTPVITVAAAGQGAV